MGNKLLFTLFFSLAALSTKAQDQIMKTDGTILNGRVLSFLNNKLILQQSDETEITLPRKAISEIRLDVKDNKVSTMSVKSAEVTKVVEIPTTVVNAPAGYTQSSAAQPNPVPTQYSDVSKSSTMEIRSKMTLESPGEISMGFENRALVQSSPLKEPVLSSGRIAVAVCVSAQGEVTTAKFKAMGSSTIDADLINAAVQNARLFRFAKAASEDCGVILYRFNMN